MKLIKKYIFCTLVLAMTLFSYSAFSKDDLLFNNEKYNDECKTATISSENNKLFSLEGSLFSNKLYVQGDKQWRPALIKFKVKKSDMLPVSGCYVKIYTKDKNSGRFFYFDKLTSDKNGEISGWWVSGAHSDAKLIAEVKDNLNSKIEIEGKVSHKKFVSTISAPYLKYGDIRSQKRWRQFQVDLTPLVSDKYTYFQVISWYGGYLGLQQGGDDETGKPLKILNWSIWKNNGEDPILINDPHNVCKLNKDSAEGTFIQCYTEYKWDLKNTYRFIVNAEYNVKNYIDYSLQVKAMDSGDVFKVGTIRVRMDNDLYPLLPSAFF